MFASTVLAQPSQIQSCPEPLAENGFLSLDCWDGTSTLALSGDWQLQLQDIHNGNNYEGLMPVPGRWRTDLSAIESEEGQSYSGFGEALYQLRLSSARRLDGLALWISLHTKPKKITLTMAGGAEYVLFDTSHLFAANPSDIPRGSPLLYLPPIEGEVLLQVQFYNGISWNGGITEPPLLAPAELLVDDRMSVNAAIAAYVVTVIFLGLTNSILAFSRSGRIAAAALAVALLGLLLRQVFTDTDFYLDSIGTISVLHSHYMGWLGLFLGMASLCFYLFCTYRYGMPKFVPWLLGVVLTIALVALAILPIEVMQRFGAYVRPLFYVCIVVVIFYMVRSFSGADKLQRYTFYNALLVSAAYLGLGIHYELANFDEIPLYYQLPAILFLAGETLLLLARYRDSLRQVGQIVDRNIKLEDMVRRDQLTGIANRRGFEEWCQANVSFGQRDMDQHFFAMLDMDFFKRINDNHGHDAGDKVLVEIATLLQKSLRGSDFAARWGGEEFCILLKHLSLDQALMTLERIRRSIEEAEIAVEAATIRVTASIGVSTVTNQDELGTAFKRADIALYKAKGKGRNRIETG